MTFRHTWKCNSEPRNGGQHVGIPRRRYICETCGLETEYTRESTFKFLKQFEDIECKEVES